MSEKKVNYSKVDSWAYWNVPSDLTAETPLEQVEKGFSNAYTLGFPKDIDTDKLTSGLGNVQYVFIGLNPGNAGPVPELFGNFHGTPKSTYRLAAAAYGTPAWGGFMTDLIELQESDSSKVAVDESAAKALIQHLDELGIPESATLIALGQKVFAALNGHLPASRHLAQMGHYAGTNGHWKIANEHQRLLEIIKNHAS